VIIYGRALLKTPLSTLQELAGSVSFRSEVDQAVVERFEVVKKLMLHSYFEYAFLDVASERALFTLEMALLRRYRDLHSADDDPETEIDGEPGSLFHLLKWAEEEHLLEDNETTLEGEHIVHHLRRMRNRTAHPKRERRYGTLAISVIQRVVEIINELYDDISLRRQRHEKVEAANRVIDDLVDNGAILSFPEDGGAEWPDRLIICRASMLHYENREEPALHFFAFQPIFDPMPDGKGGLHIPSPFVISAVSWETKEGSLYIRTPEKHVITVRPIQKTENKKRYSEWRRDVNESDFSVSVFIEQQLGRFKMNLRHHPYRGGRGALFDE
jgi:hypothetical protein